MASQTYIAVDLGAGSGRVIAALYNGRTLELEVIHRFPNHGIRLPTGWHWNISQLFAEIQTGLATTCRKYGDSVVSLAIDTWGVDYGLVDRRGRLLGLPWMYRDGRTDGVMEGLAGIVPREEMYRRTGIQFLPFNTIYQLAAEARDYPEILKGASQLLFIPDLLTYWLTGERITERTIASTSQLLRAGRGEWDLDLVGQLGIPSHIFQTLTEPNTPVGKMLPEFGCGDLSVVACGGHDTASAVAGIPSTTGNPLFLSSGTWSLIGRELPQPLLTPESFAAGFSNEHGLCGTTRFLKNVTGMWLIQECMRCWAAEDASVDLPKIIRLAASCKIASLIDPDDEAFQKSCDMPVAIRRWLDRSGQPIPSSREEMVAIILRSLALKYRSLIERLRHWMPDLPGTLHVVGGGSQNSLLNQFTADATGLRVEAGPVEATAAGNILSQLIAAGEISTLAEGREILRSTFAPQVFEPQSGDSWNERAAQLEQLLQPS